VYTPPQERHLPFDYAACKAALRETTYQRCNRRAEEAKRQQRARAIARGNWWMQVDWIEWVDEPSAESRPTERIAMILMSNKYRRAMEALDRWWVINTLRFAYDKAHELPLGALLNARGLKLVFIEVGRKGSGKYKSVQMPAA
jgi:hypothetical protein